MGTSLLEGGNMKTNITSNAMMHKFNEIYKDNKNAEKIVDFMKEYFEYELQKAEFQVRFNYDGNTQYYISEIETSIFADDFLEKYLNDPTEDNLIPLFGIFMRYNFNDILKKINYKNITLDDYRLFRKELGIDVFELLQINLGKIDASLIKEIGGLAETLRYVSFSYYDLSKLEITKEMILEEYNNIPLIQVLNFIFDKTDIRFTKEELDFLKNNYKRKIGVTSQIKFGMQEEDELLESLALGVSNKAKKILTDKIDNEENEDEKFSDSVKLFVKLM